MHHVLAVGVVRDHLHHGIELLRGYHGDLGGDADGRGVGLIVLVRTMDGSSRLTSIDDLQPAKRLYCLSAIREIRQINVVSSEDDIVVISKKPVGFIFESLAYSAVHRLAAANSKERTYIQFKKPRTIFIIKPIK